MIAEPNKRPGTEWSGRAIEKICNRKNPGSLLIQYIGIEILYCNIILRILLDTAFQ
jgi:hypothetical protein